MIIAVHKARNSDKSTLTEAQIKKFTLNYEKIIKSANKYYPPPDVKTKN